MGKFAEYVKRYEAALSAAEAKYGEACQEARNAYYRIEREHDWNSPEVREADRVRRAANEAAGKARAEEILAAWRALAEIPDPVAQWIVKNCEANQYEAIKVIPHLPAPLDELDELADELDFCSVWDRYRIMALRAGVFSEAKMTPERADLHEIVRDNLGPLRGRRRTKFDALLDKVVKAEIKAAATA